MYEQVQTYAQSHSTSGPFHLKEEIINEIEKDWIRVDQIKHKQLQPLDFSFSEQPLRIKSTNGSVYPTERLNQLLTKSPPRPHSANVSLYSVSSPQHYSTSSMRPATAPENDLIKISSPKLDTKLLSLIKGIGHPDRLVSHASLIEVSDIMESQEKQAVLRDYDEIYIESVLEQFKVRILKKNWFQKIISS